MNSDRLAKLAEEIVHEYREARNVVHVRVSDDDVPNRPLLRFAESDSDATGINGHAVVDDKASQALSGGRAALRIERAW